MSDCTTRQVAESDQDSRHSLLPSTDLLPSISRQRSPVMREILASSYKYRLGVAILATLGTVFFDYYYYFPRRLDNEHHTDAVQLALAAGITTAGTLTSLSLVVPLTYYNLGKHPKRNFRLMATGLNSILSALSVLLVKHVTKDPPLRLYAKSGAPVLGAGILFTFLPEISYTLGCCCTSGKHQIEMKKAIDDSDTEGGGSTYA